MRHGIGVDQRPDVVVFVEWVADADLLVRLRQLIAHLVVDAAVDDQAACGGATLTASTHGAKHGCGDDHFEVGIRCDDDGVVSPQFKQSTTQTKTV